MPKKKKKKRKRERNRKRFKIKMLKGVKTTGFERGGEK
jgi:hypothetical protein